MHFKILPSAKPSQPEAAKAALGKICGESIVAVPAVMLVVKGHWDCGLVYLSGQFLRVYLVSFWAVKLLL